MIGQKLKCRKKLTRAIEKDCIKSKEETPKTKKFEIKTRPETQTVIWMIWTYFTKCHLVFFILTTEWKTPSRQGQAGLSFSGQLHVKFVC